MKKICVMTTSLGGGGAEKFSGILSQMLAKLNYDVHVLSTKNVIDFAYSGKLFNLELQLKFHKNQLNKILVLKKYFKKNKFDVIIDNRPRSIFFKEYIIYKFVFKALKIIPVVHNYKTEYYLPENKFLARILYKNVHKIVCVSEKIKLKIIEEYNLKEVITIYNPADFNTIIKKSNQPITIKSKNKYILYFGRIEDKSKNITLLLKGYKASGLAENNILLFILGKGPDLSVIKDTAKNLSLTKHVVFLPHTTNPYPYVKEALFTVMTSRYEGFPLALIESLVCETPVISVDFDSGPSEIIKHRENGLLINNYDEKALAKAMNLFVENHGLYFYCKRNTRESIKHLEINEIASQWQKIIEAYD